MVDKNFAVVGKAGKGYMNVNAWIKRKNTADRAAARTIAKPHVKG